MRTSGLVIIETDVEVPSNHVKNVYNFELQRLNLIGDGSGFTISLATTVSVMISDIVLTKTQRGRLVVTLSHLSYHLVYLIDRCSADGFSDFGHFYLLIRMNFIFLSQGYYSSGFYGINGTIGFW